MRDKILQTYAVDRVYRVENKRVNKQAMVKARMFFVAPEEKLFEVQSYSGSDFMRKGVLNRLIETERQSAPGRIQEKTAISPDNYDFQLLRQESVKNRPQYVLRAKPRQKEGLLFDGIIWVDAVDYAVTRIEARPAKNPSFWTRKVNFVQEYGKFDALWFPMRNTSVASVFIFGNTTTEIEYGNYQINRPELLEQAAEVRKRGAKLEIKVDAKDKRSGNQ